MVLEAHKFTAGTEVLMQVGESELKTILPNEGGQLTLGHTKLQAGKQDLRFSILKAPTANRDAIELMKMAVFKLKQQ